MQPVPHDIASVGQLPEQFQGRRVVAGGLQLVLEFLFDGPGAALLESARAAAAARPSRSVMRRPISCSFKACSARRGLSRRPRSGRASAARPPSSRAYSPSSSRRSPGWAISSGRHGRRRRRHQVRLGQQHFEQLPLLRGGRGLAFGLVRVRPARRRPRVRRAAALLAQFVQACPYGLLLESQALSDPGDHQLRLDRAGLSGQAAAPGRSRPAPRPPPAAALPRRGVLPRPAPG